jgi:hypothetical protein
MTHEGIEEVFIRYSRHEVGSLLDDSVANPARGHVSWDGFNKTGIEEFFEAILLGLSLVESDLSDEWLIFGPSVVPLVRQLRQFTINVERPFTRGHPFYKIGEIQGIQCFYYPSFKGEDPINAPFLCGNGPNFCVGSCFNVGSYFSHFIPAAG